jgi:hypothetical protein
VHQELDKRDQSAASYLGYDQQSWNAELEDSGVDAAGGDDHAERDLMGVGGGGRTHAKHTPNTHTSARARALPLSSPCVGTRGDGLAGS